MARTTTVSLLEKLRRTSATMRLISRYMVTLKAVFRGLTYCHTEDAAQRWRIALTKTAPTEVLHKELRFDEFLTALSLINYVMLRPR